MGDILALKLRQNNIKAVYEITDAMQIIATIIIGRAQKVLSYRRKVQSQYDRLFLTKELDKKKAAEKSQEWLVIFFSEKGFCGNFNGQLLPLLAKNRAIPNVICVGSRGKQFCERIGIKPVHCFAGASKVPDEANIKEVFEVLKGEGFPAKTKVIVNKYNNMFVQVPKIVDFFPHSEDVFRSLSSVIDMDESVLDDVIVEKYVEGRLFYFFTQNFAGETASKLLMMQSAVESAEKLKEEVAKEIYKERQLKITQELSEIISAYKVLQLQEERR